MPNQNNTLEEFKQHPPIPVGYWVQQLQNPEAKGNIILSIDYVSDIEMPQTLKLYLSKTNTLMLADDGVFPDKIPNDGRCSTLIKQNPQQFINEYNNKIALVNEKGRLFHFTGHVGKMYRPEELIKFDQEAFEDFEQVAIDAMIINETFCEDYSYIEKHKSLFITDLRVVEDPARTYNVVSQTGNPIGAWTFGSLMRDMAGGFSNPPTLQEQQKVKQFLKLWVLGLKEPYTINNRTATERDEKSLKLFVIIPWLVKAHQQDPNNSTITIDNWEEWWEQADILELLINAPFKLTAIVNRLDLRASSAYNNNINNTGETRFVYSLIKPYDSNLANNAEGVGTPPFYKNTEFENIRFIDWQGMNVILEYGNTETDLCELKQRAQDWIDLSAYNLDDFEQRQEYLNQLQVLTNTVTSKNAAPERPNGSAINQVRSNEKLLAVVAPQNNWEDANWQLRQFELNQDGWLLNAPVSNVPFDNNNFAYNNHKFNEPTTSTEIIDWIYGVNQPANKHRVRQGNHILPDALSEPVAELKDEMMHYYGLDFWNDNVPDFVYDKDNDDGNSSLREKEIRRQISLNTCMGCHGGETKTVHTFCSHCFPLKYLPCIAIYNYMFISMCGLISLTLESLPD